MHQHAVLQVLLRLSLANQHPSESLGSARARWAEEVLPWENEVQRLQFKPSFPTLAQIWTVLVVQKVRDMQAWTALYLLKAIDLAADRSCGLTQDTWYQWSTRCREHLRENEPDAWKVLRRLLEPRNMGGK